MKKNCRFCDKDGTAWLYPLIYSVATSETPSKLATLPALAAPLGAGVTDLKLSEYARYAVRRVRQGYAYVLIERASYRYWLAYMANDDGFLYQFDAEQPPTDPVPFTCERNVCGVGASVIGIEKVSTVDNVWLMFTPTAMTKAKLDEYRSNAPAYASKGKMRYFDAKGWVAGSTGQPHTLKPEKLASTAMDFILFAQHAQAHSSPLGTAMKAQLFPAPSDAYAGSPRQADGTENGFLGVLAQKLAKEKAAVVVLDDHIGITQTLNDFRNAALEPIDMFLASKDARQVDNQRKLEVVQAIDDVRAGFEKAMITDNQEYLDTSRNWSEERQNHRLRQAKMFRAQGNAEDADLIEKDVARLRAERDKNYDLLLNQARAEAPQCWKKKYETRLDSGEIIKFKNTLKAFSDHGFKLATLRAGDHLAWVSADRLVDAFDIYDTKSPGAGFAFTLHHSVCTLGMVGVKKSAEVMDKWMKVDKVERKNLYMRAYLFNQDHLQEEANRSLGEVKALIGSVEDISLVDSKLWLKAMKGLVDGFKKLDSAWDEWVRDKKVREVHLNGLKPGHSTDIRSLSQFHRTAEGIVFKFISEFTQSTARLGVGGKFDKGMAAVASLMLQSRLGNLTQDLAHDLLLLRIPPEKLAEGYKKRSAARNAELQARHVDRRAATVAAKADDAIEMLVKDAQAKAREKVKLTLDQLDKGERGPTNNYHQARIGAVLMAIESFALFGKYQHFDASARAKADIAASVMSLTSMGLDMLYAVAKSIREIEPYKGIPALERAADIIRGGLKLTAGALATAAGGVGAVLDFDSAIKEKGKRDPDVFLLSIYVSRGAVGLWSAYIGLTAAFSYCAPLLMRVGVTAGRFSFQALSLAAYGTVVAESLAASRTLLLIRVARWNMVGLALTGVEIGYRLFFKDNELQDWCDACTFRKDKSKGLFKAKPYEDITLEMQALYKAAKAIGVGA